MKKRFLQISVVVILLFSGLWTAMRHDGKEPMDTRKASQYLIPSRERYWAVIKTEPYAMFDFSDESRMAGITLPPDILDELQGYMPEGRAWEALVEWQDSGLIVSKETLLERCPEYYTLLEDWLLRHEEAADAIVEDSGEITSVFFTCRLPSYNGEENIWLVCHEGTWRLYAVVLKETAEGFSIMGATSFGNDIPTCMFGRKEGGEIQYYCLYSRRIRSNTNETNGMTLEKFSVCQDDSGEGVAILWDKLWLADVFTSVYPEYYYLDEKNPFLPEVRKYVEENLELFAHKEYTDIWGDEKVLSEEQEEELAEALGYRLGSLVLADYDNDGKEELFCRGIYDIRQLSQQEDGTYSWTEWGGESEYKKWMGLRWVWFAEFGGKTISFQMLGDVFSQRRVLTASLVEGERTTPILSAQLCFRHEVSPQEAGGYGGEPEGTFYQSAPLLETTGKESLESSLKEEVLEKLQAETAVHAVEETDMEPGTLEGLFALLKKDTYLLLCGAEAGYLDAYALDIERDTKEFQKFWEEDLGGDGVLYLQYQQIEWVWRYPSESGKKEYLVSSEDGYYAWVERYSVSDNGEIEYLDEVWTGFGENYHRVISYGGQKYFVFENRNFYAAALRGMAAVPLDAAGEGEGAVFVLEPQIDGYECIPLFTKEGAPAALSAYVESRFRKIAAACLAEEMYQEEKMEEPLSLEQLRIMKNLSYGYYGTDRGWGYDLCDVDNDGMAEYVEYNSYNPAKHYGDYKFITGTVYKSADGKFREYSLEGITREWYNMQLWFQEIDGITYLFTVELYSGDDYVLRIKVINGGSVEEVAVYLLKAGYREAMEITEMPFDE